MIRRSGRRLPSAIGVLPLHCAPFPGLHPIMATALAFRFSKIALDAGTLINTPLLALRAV
jgi:hypothetical protein